MLGLALLALAGTTTVGLSWASGFTGEDARLVFWGGAPGNGSKDSTFGDVDRLGWACSWPARLSEATCSSRPRG